MSVRILLVEDHLPLRLSLAASLRQAGYEVTAVCTGEEADQVLAAEAPGLVVLDWMLPTRSGPEVLAAWRARGLQVPVILLTARDAVGDRVRGLRSGAQDYVVKPFATEELLARIEVQLRDRGIGRQLLTLADRVVDLARHEVRRGDALLGSLTTKEAQLLQWLADRPGRVVGRDDLLREVWGYRAAGVTRTVDNTVLRLRGKIEVDPARPRHVVTVHGAGYRFEP
ncbi:MAG: response regulator transcription factor [Myxococcota bacterium]